MTPTADEIEALARELRLQAWHSDPRQFATWILTRFVRREKHERVVAHIESSHNEVVCSSTLRHADDGGDPVPLLTCMTWDSHCLRAELRGQRCDGSGKLRGTVAGLPSGLGCPGCPACKPTPKSDKPCDIHSVGLHTDNCNRGRTPESVSVLEQHCSDADFETIGKMRDESYAAGYSAGRDDAARLNIQEVVHVTKLHEDTLRALVAALSVLWPRDIRQNEGPVETADNLLAKLKETKG